MSILSTRILLILIIASAACSRDLKSVVRKDQPVDSALGTTRISPIQITTVRFPFHGVLASRFLIKD